MKLVHNGQLSLFTLISKLTSEPARLTGNKYGTLGTLAIGTPADVVILNPAMDWSVDTKYFASRGKNTPLADSMLKGKVVATIFQGELVYKDDSIKLEARGC
jgi:dihydroorotase